MPLITLKEYAEKYFSEGSRPSYHQVWRWASRGFLPVKRFGNSLYINTDKLEASTNPRVNRILQSTKNGRQHG